MPITPGYTSNLNFGPQGSYGTMQTVQAPSGGGGDRMAFVAPLIGAGASLGGAALGGKQASKAANAQLQANREALNFQREQEASRRAQYDQAMAQYKQQWDAWNASRNALLQRYGIDIAPPSGGAGAPGAAVPPMAGAGAPGPGGPGPVAGPGPQMAQAQPANIGEMIGRGRPGEWSDWSRYGLRR